MQIARVIGTVVATKKHQKFEGAKLLLVQPLMPNDTPRGPELLAVDGVGAGVHEKVLIVLEGRAAALLPRTSDASWSKRRRTQVLRLPGGSASWFRFT